MPMTVAYSLTPMGRTLLPIIANLRGWSMANIDAVTAAQEHFDQNVRSGRADAAP